MNDTNALELRSFESAKRKQEALKEVKAARKRRKAREKEILAQHEMEMDYRVVALGV